MVVHHVVLTSMTVVHCVQVFRQRTTADAIELVSHLLDYTPSRRHLPLDACAHSYFDELRDPATRLSNGRDLPPLFNFTHSGLVGLYFFASILVHFAHLMFLIWHQEGHPASKNKSPQYSNPIELQHS